jgi:hypothetical protein
VVAQWLTFQKGLDVRELFRSVIQSFIKELTALIVTYYALAAAKAIAGMGGGYGDGTMTQSQAAAAGYLGPGFATGGFTGNGPRNALAGFVHGQEFVMPAHVTARHRGTLEAMRAGASPTPNIVINNNAPGVSVRTDYVGPDEVRLICEETVAKNAPRVVAGSLSNPNSPMSKSLRTNTTSSRRLG